MNIAQDLTLSYSVLDFQKELTEDEQRWLRVGIHPFITRFEWDHFRNVQLKYMNLCIHGTPNIGIFIYDQYDPYWRYYETEFIRIPFVDYRLDQWNWWFMHRRIVSFKLMKESWLPFTELDATDLHFEKGVEKWEDIDYRFKIPLWMFNSNNEKKEDKRIKLLSDGIAMRKQSLDEYLRIFLNPDEYVREQLEYIDHEEEEDYEEREFKLEEGMNLSGTPSWDDDTDGDILVATKRSREGEHASQISMVDSLLIYKLNNLKKDKQIEAKVSSTSSSDVSIDLTSFT